MKRKKKTKLHKYSIVTKENTAKFATFIINSNRKIKNKKKTKMNTKINTNTVETKKQLQANTQQKTKTKTKIQIHYKRINVNYFGCDNMLNQYILLVTCQITFHFISFH